MSKKSSKTNQLDPNDFNSEELIPVRRRGADGMPEDVVDPNTVEEELPPIKTSDKVTTYSAKSEVRTPIKLVQNIFEDFWAGRELSWRLFLRNLRGLYRQTLLGLFWIFLPPIANTAFWIFLKSAKVFDGGTTEVDPVVFILAGMILWQAFIDSFQMPLSMLAKNGNMISKLNFPRESLLLVGFGEILFNLIIRLLLLIPAFIYFGVPFHATLLLAPFAVLTLVMLGASFGLLIMPFGSLYQDVGRFIGIAMPFWMIITPVVYTPLEGFPWSLLNVLNPASPLLLLSRDWMLLGTSEYWQAGLIFGAFALPMLLLGLIVYRISIPVLVERMNA